MKKTLLLLCSLSAIYADTVNLEHIIEQTKQKHPLFQALKHQQLALKAQREADFASEPFALSLSGANASPDEGDDAVEYSVGLSKNFAFGDTKSLAKEARHYTDSAIMISQEKALISISNRIQNLYHQSCLDRKNSTLLTNSLSAFEKLYAKKQKAYKYHEISKKELLQLQMQLREIRQKVQSSQAKERISKERLYDESELDETLTLSCQDLTPLSPTVKTDLAPFMLSADAFAKELQAMEKLQKRYNKSIDSIEIGTTYDDEIDTKRVGIGFAMPLSFTSQKNEKNRVALLHKEELKRFQFHNKMIQKMGEHKSLKAKLQTSYDAIIMIEDNLQSYQETLMPLIEKSFQLGESSVIEYIFGQQKLIALSQELIEKKKSYYNTLFNLYTTIELEKK